LIRRARRRHLSNLVLKHTVNAVSFVLAGLTVLLIAGTEILDWPWLAALLAAGVIAGAVRISRQLPTDYFIAQSIDHKLAFHDALSTAFFYARPNGRQASSEVRDTQRAQAERLAANVDPANAVPFAFPRSLYVMAALGLLASSIFGLRYGVTHRLDLHPSLAKIVFDAFHMQAQQQQAQAKRKDSAQQRVNDLLKQMGLSLDPEGQRDGTKQDSSTVSEQTVAQERQNRTSAGERGKDSATVEQAKPGQQQNENAEGQGDSMSEESPDSRPSASQRDSSRQGEQQSASNQPGPPSNENNSLMDKFRDAMANLLSKLKSQPKQGDQQQSASANQGTRSDQTQRRQSTGQKGAQGQGKQGSEGMNADGQGDSQEGEATQKAQNGTGKQGAKDAGLESSKEGKSGIGKEDGNKDIRQAEQLAAMGKISEIIGKRSASLTGEMMVETPSGKQQLKTAYSQQAANHMDIGGEIHRDEIPLAFQRYVQQYFEEIRKPAKKP
jgi:hypothetical protein